MPIAGILWIINVSWKIFKSVKNKNKLRTIYLKIKKIFRAANLGSNFTGSYKKEYISTGRRKPFRCNQGSTLSFW